MTWAYVAVGAGTAVGGAAGGKKARKGNKAANLQADISNRLFTETDPLRQSLIGRSSAFLGAPTMGTAGTPPRTINIMGVPVSIGGQESTAVPGTPGAGLDVTATPTFAAYKNVADRTFG